MDHDPASSGLRDHNATRDSATAWLTHSLRRLSSFARSLTNPSFLLLLAAIALYSWYWSEITIDRFYGMNAGVFDLGLFVQHVWVVTSPQLSPPNRLLYILDQPFLVLLVPLVWAHSYPVVLTVQTIALALGAIPLYFIAIRLLRSEWTALLVALTYLIYPPLAGVNWFDAHYIAFFVPLFLFGYLFFLGRFRTSAGVCFFFAAATEYPSELVVMLFAVILLVTGLIHRGPADPPRDPPPVRFAAALLVATSLLFVYQSLYLGNFNFVLAWSAFTRTAHPLTAGATFAFQARLLGILVILGPLLAFPVIAPRWIVLASPMPLLSIVSTYPGYVYPMLFQDQYLAIMVPPLFIGLVYSIRQFDVWHGRNGVAVPPSSASHATQRKLRSVAGSMPRPVVLGVTVLVSTLVFASFFQPYGAFNSAAGDNFYLGAETQANRTFFNQVQTALSLVPSTTPYLLFQNDMPTALPRPLDYYDTPLVSAIQDWENVTPWDATHNAFPLVTPLGYVVNAQIDYLVDAPYGWGFTEKGSEPGNEMSTFADVLYGSGQYGVLGEIHGDLVLARGYTLGPEVYVPYTDQVLGSSLCDGDCPTGTSEASVSNASNQSDAWGATGPAFTLSPGLYNASFSLMTTNTSGQNHYTQSALICCNPTLLAHAMIRGSSFSAPNRWQTFTLEFYLNNTYTTVLFPGSSAAWSGTLFLRWVAITQVAPPAPTG
jgi:uncharacterized membrane protein